MTSPNTTRKAVTLALALFMAPALLMASPAQARHKNGERNAGTERSNQQLNSAIGDLVNSGINLGNESAAESLKETKKYLDQRPRRKKVK